VMIVVKNQGWLNTVIAAEACYNANLTALQGLGKVWIPAAPYRDAAPAVGNVKREIDNMMKVRGVKEELY
jgi:hypothetical protein